MADAVLMIAAMALSTASAAPLGECRVLLVPKQPGEEVVLADTAPVGCTVRPESKHAEINLVYNSRRKIVVAREALSAGQNLGHVYFPPRPEVRVGDRLSLTAHFGHVAISREVFALQNAQAGQRFFVRDRDGQVFVKASAKGDAEP